MSTDSVQIRFVTYFFTRLPWRQGHRPRRGTEECRMDQGRMLPEEVPEADGARREFQPEPEPAPPLRLGPGGSHLIARPGMVEGENSKRR